jgi:predicted phosphodiesterase
VKIVLLADIHSNLAALEAVLAHVDTLQPDRVIVAGDVVNRGPRPEACLARIAGMRRDCGWLVFRGNHEDYLLAEAEQRDERPEWAQDLCRHTAWTHHRIRSELDEIRRWPGHVEFEGPGGQLIRVVHGSMHGNRAGLYDHMEDDVLHNMVAPTLSGVEGPAPAVLGAGHTHIPFVRKVKSTLIVNAGAAGLPFDGDQRASFAVIDMDEHGARAEIVRVPYDLARAERDFHETGYLADGGMMVPLILQELHQAKARIGVWHARYEKLVAAGKMGMRESVQELLSVQV